MKPGIRVGTYSYVSPLPQLEEEAAPGNSQFSDVLWVGLGATVSLGYELRTLLSIGNLMPGTGFALGAISLTHVPLGLNVTLVHSFQMFSPALWSDVDRRHSLQQVGL